MPNQSISPPFTKYSSLTNTTLKCTPSGTNTLIQSPLAESTGRENCLQNVWPLQEKNQHQLGQVLRMQRQRHELQVQHQHWVRRLLRFHLAFSLRHSSWKTVRSLRSQVQRNQIKPRRVRRVRVQFLLPAVSSGHLNKKRKVYPSQRLTACRGRIHRVVQIVNQKHR